MKILRFRLLLPLLLLVRLPLTAQEVVTVDTVADLLKLHPTLAGGVTGGGTLKAQVQTRGRTAVGDGGAGSYAWIEGATTATNRGTVFASTQVSPGRWTLLGNPGDIRLWGAVPGGADCAPAIQAAINALTATSAGGATKPEILIPNGQWHIATTLSVTNPVHLHGEGLEKNSVDTASYNLNGSVLVSDISSSIPMIELVGRSFGGAATYLQGIEITDIGLDGSNGSESYGIQITANSNTSDVNLRRLLIRNVGLSGIRSGAGTQSTSPRWGYSQWEQITVIAPGKDGIEFYCSNFDAVGMQFNTLYVNGAGRHGLNIYNLGNFTANNWSENNSAQLEAGYGMYLRNVVGANLSGVYLEGDGRYQASGASGKPLFNAAAAKLMGVTDTTINSLQVFSPTGIIGAGATNSGAIEIGTSAGDNGWSVRGSAALTFNSPTLVGFANSVAIPTASAAGSSGSLSSGIYSYAITQVMTNTGAGTTWETPISASGRKTLSVTALNTVSITGIATGNSIAGSPQVASRIYRTLVGGKAYKLVATTTGTSYSDTMSDATLSLVADKDDFRLVYITSDTGHTYWNNVTVNTDPLIRDLSGRMQVDGVYVKQIDPATQQWPGTMTFNGTIGGYHGGLTHVFGADVGGFYQGVGVTPNESKAMRMAVMRYDASRPEQDYPVSVLQGSSPSAGNGKAILGGSSSTLYSVESVVLAPGSGVVNDAVEVLNATPARVALTVPLHLTNAVALYGLNTSGTAVKLAEVNAGNIASIGPGSGTTRLNLLPGTDGLYLGQKGLATPLWVSAQDNATGGSPLKNSQTLAYLGSYWNGSAATEYVVSSQLNMDGTGPTASLYYSFGGVNKFRFQENGNLTATTFTGALAGNADTATKLAVTADYLGAGAFAAYVTNGAAPATTTLTSGQPVDTFAFDAATVESIGFTLPAKAATFTATITWLTTATSGDVVWSVSARLARDGDDTQGAMGTAQTVVDTAAGTTLYERITSATSTVTPSGTYGVGATLYLTVSRSATSGSDTLSVDALFKSVTLTWN